MPAVWALDLRSYRGTLKAIRGGIVDGRCRTRMHPYWAARRDRATAAGAAGLNGGIRDGPDHDA